MSLFALIRRSLAQRKLGAALTALGVALGVMLVVAVLMIYVQIKAYYDAQGGGYPLVVGAEGYDLQLVQNVVYHTDRSPGNIPYSTWTRLRAEPWVRLAVPYGVGDSFRGFRVVGTSDALFDPMVRPKGGAPLRFAEGRPFKTDLAVVDAVAEVVAKGGAVPDAARPKFVREAVLGAEVARKLKLKIGDHIEPTHGVEGAKKHEDDAPWTVTGILAATGGAIDRVVFIGIESFLGIEDHLLGGRLPSGEAGLSAVLVWPKGKVALATMTPRWDAEPGLQAVRPAEVIRTKLYETHLKPAQRTLLMVTLFNVLTGVIGVGVALYNTMNERRREIAILRAVGASRGFIVRLLVGEATVLAGAGAAAGLVLARSFLLLMQLGAANFGLFGQNVAFTPDPWRFESAPVFDLWPPDVEDPPRAALGSFVLWGVGDPPSDLPSDDGAPRASLTVLGMGPFVVAREIDLSIDVMALVGAMLVGGLAGLLPALKGYRTPVAENLAPVA